MRKENRKMLSLLPLFLIPRFSTSLLFSYHHLVWLALIGNISELSSLSTLSKLIMKPNHPGATKTLAELKCLESIFANPGSQVPRNESSMDWSEKIPEVQSTPISHVTPAGRNMSSPHAPLLNRDAKGKGRMDSIDSSPSVLNYSRN